MGRDDRGRRRAEPRRTRRPGRDALGLPELAGAYLVPIVFVGAAAVLSFALLRPDPYELADASSRHDTRATRRVTGLAGASSPARTCRVAIVALVAGQFVMVLIMTMTPLHMAAAWSRPGGRRVRYQRPYVRDVRAVTDLRSPDRPIRERAGHPGRPGGLAIAVDPGRRRTAGGGVLLFLALFLLGYGWNLGYVAGSALLTHGLSLAERTRVQGLTDTLIWSSAAVASLGSGFVLAYAGYAILGLMGAALVVVPASCSSGRGPAGRSPPPPASQSGACRAGLP